VGSLTDFAIFDIMFHSIVDFPRSDWHAKFLRSFSVMQEMNPSNGSSRPDLPVDAQKRILVVDDEDMIRELSESILKKKGYYVDTASDGETAQALLEDNSYDLVIADVWMPGSLSGMDLFKWAKENKPAMENKIIFMTGDAVAEEVQSFLEETQRPCLPKPFGLAEYLKVVQANLDISP
jgi:DNA-binding NtrC family response regulator